MERSEWDEPLVHSISTAPASKREDHDHRVRVYLLSMGIRSVSFLLAALFGFVLDVPWAAWLFMLLAVVLPYPAVVWANNRDRHVSAAEVESPLGVPPGITGSVYEPYETGHTYRARSGEYTDEHAAAHSIVTGDGIEVIRQTPPGTP